MRNAGRCPRGFAPCLIAFFSLLLSACASEEAKKQGLDVLRKSEISAPRFEAEDILGGINPQREKVSRLEVVAPPAGTLISSYRVLYGRPRGEKVKVGQDFLIVEDMEPAVREASSYLFEIAPTANKYAVVELKVDASTVLRKEMSCEPFVTIVNLRLQIQEVSSDGAKETENYESVATDESCTSFLLPFADAVQDPLNDAFSEAFVKAVRARSVVEQAGALRTE